MAFGSDSQQKRGSKPQVSCKPKTSPQRLHFHEQSVGEPWSGTVETSKIEIIRDVSNTDRYKHGVIFTITVLCSCLILGIGTHAALTGNEERLDKLLDIAWKGLIAVGLWATGAATLKALRGVKIDAD